MICAWSSTIRRCTTIWSLPVKLVSSSYVFKSTTAILKVAVRWWRTFAIGDNKVVQWYITLVTYTTNTLYFNVKDTFQSTDINLSSSPLIALGTDTFPYSRKTVTLWAYLLYDIFFFSDLDSAIDTTGGWNISILPIERQTKVQRTIILLIKV